MHLEGPGTGGSSSSAEQSRRDPWLIEQGDGTCFPFYELGTWTRHLVDEAIAIAMKVGTCWATQAHFLAWAGREAKLRVLPHALDRKGKGPVSLWRT
jgi:hypothetical protein